MESQLGSLKAIHIFAFLACCTTFLKYSSAVPIEIPPIKIPAVIVPMKESETSYEYDEDASQEKVCPKNMYWHNRGGQCVPERCPHGRHSETGRCKKPEPIYRSLAEYEQPNRRGRNRG